MSGFYADDPFGDPFAEPVAEAVPSVNPYTATTAAEIAPVKVAAALIMAVPTPVGDANPFDDPIPQQGCWSPAPPVVPERPSVYPTPVSPAPAGFQSQYMPSSPAVTMPMSSPSQQPLQPQSLGYGARPNFAQSTPSYTSTEFQVPTKAWSPASQSAPTSSPAQKFDVSAFDPFSPVKAAPVPASSPVTSSPQQQQAAVAPKVDKWETPFSFGEPKKQTTPVAKTKKAAVVEKPIQQVSFPQSARQKETAAERQSATSPVLAAPVAIPDGVLLARVSTRSIFVREWKPAYWVIVNHRLWIYRSKADYNPTDYIHNPFNERIKKSIHLRDNLRVTEMKSKIYPGESRTLYTFGIEDLDEDGGKSLLSKFAAYDYDSVRKLREELDTRIFALRHGGNK